MKYNHMMDVAFVVISTKKDADDLTYEEILLGMAKRLTYLLEHKDGEAFGICDSYEIQERNKESD